MNPIEETTDDKTTYGNWLKIWSRCLHPEPAEAKIPILATGEQFTPAIDPDNMAEIESTKIKEFIELTTFEIIGISIPKVAHDEPIENDKIADIINDVNGIKDSGILHEDIISFI